MNTTYATKPSDIERKWYVVDAQGVVLGRLSAEIAKILRGKHKPNFVPNIDCGDYVVVINADKVKLTGKKLTDKNISNIPVGLAASRKPRLLKSWPVVSLKELSSKLLNV